MRKLRITPETNPHACRFGPAAIPHRPSGTTATNPARCARLDTLSSFPATGDPDTPRTTVLGESKD